MQPIVTALSMSLYGMFLAIIIPPARGDSLSEEKRIQSKNLLFVLIACFVLSGLCAVMPIVGQWSSGMRTVVLTTPTLLPGILAFVAGIIAAWSRLGLFPVAAICCVIAYLLI